MREKFKSRRFKRWLTIVLAGGTILLLYFFFKNIVTVGHGIGTLVYILSPFIFGMVMAYLVCPIYNVIVRNTYRITHRGRRSGKRAMMISKSVGSILSIIIIFAVLIGVGALLIPQLVKSIMALIDVLPGRIEALEDFINTQLTNRGNPELALKINEAIDKGLDYVIVWLQDTLLPGASNIMAGLTDKVISIGKLVFNFFIGIIICVYVLNAKEQFKANMKRFIVGHFKREKSDRIFDFGHFCNKTFMGFISGKIIDSAIIGIICFVICMILKLPYAPLLATIIGVTNIIPFFGPFIGAIPCLILLVILNPWAALKFLITVFALQIFDGYILGPKILGDATGLSGFWVMFSIIVGGGLFGVVGMLLAVPVFAIFAYYLNKRVERRLFEKGLPTKANDYKDFNKYDADRKDVL